MKPTLLLRITLFIFVLMIGSMTGPAQAAAQETPAAQPRENTGVLRKGDTAPASIDWNNGPGGPILVITDPASGFGRYYAEILRAEGLNEFAVADVSTITAEVLNGYDVVILAHMAITDPQAALLNNWVAAGGNLVAMRPDARLAALLGITPAGGSLSNAYMLVDTASGPGVGTANTTLQYHGTADLYTLNGAATVASLYSDAVTPTSNPAVTLRNVGSNGGQAAAFTYDLSRSIVYTRQGNPDWAGTERDSIAPIRGMDLFFGNASGDPQPDWVDFNKIAIPQADEQQRLLARLIQVMELDNMPLPRFWYFPRDARAVVLLTGDVHDLGALPERLDHYMALSPSGCSVTDWECVRSSMYIYDSSTLTNAQAETYTAAGFEIGIHLNIGCMDYTPASLQTAYATQLGQFQARFPNLPLQNSERDHCVTWSDWSSQPALKEQLGIRLDTNYYYWPDAWVQNRPGLFTGSGMPMRFADLDGSMFDVYQATTQMSDESNQTYPFTVDTLLDRAIGPEGYYGVFTANMHAISAYSPGADAIIASAQARGVPIVSGRQLLTWLDGRGGSSFSALNWSTGSFSFHITAAAGSNGMRAMLPNQSASGTLLSITRNGSPASFTTSVIKGVEYAFFDALTGDYEAAYSFDDTPPVISGVDTVLNLDGTGTISWTTDEFSTSRVDYGTSAGTLNLSSNASALVTSHSLTLSALTPGTTYYFRVSSTDSSGNPAVSPEPPAGPLSFTTFSGLLGDDLSGDFGAGTPGCTYISQTSNGELILPPTTGAEFNGTSLPAGWTGAPWSVSGSVTVSGGQLTLNNAYARVSNMYTAGHILEFVATFSNQTPTQLEHAGFGFDLISGSWALFSTGSSGGSLKARSSGAVDTDLGTAYLGSPHLYRIEWYSDHIVYRVDGIQVANHSVSIPGNMRPIVSDGADAAVLTVDWMRMGPYASPCTFVSRVLDAGQPVDWFDLFHSGTSPAGTAISFETRSGFSAIPDGNWSAWQPLSGTHIASPHSRYIQYRVTLSSTDPLLTPVIGSVVITYNAIQPITISGNAGAASVILEYMDGSPQSVQSNGAGEYSFQVLYGWSGTVTPSKPGYGFTPASRTYTFVTGNQTNQDYTITPCRSLSVSVLPPAGGSVDISPASNCAGGLYLPGTVVTLTATANPGYAFSSWTGGAAGAAKQTTVTMDADKSATAVFSLIGQFVNWAGSVSVTADRAVVAVGRPHVGAEVASYDGVSAGSLTAYAPMLFKNAFGGSYDAALYVQNVDPAHGAAITIKFYDSNGNLSCNLPDTIAPLASKGYWIPSLSCLPAGWVGGAVVTSDKPIVLVGRPHVGFQVMTYNGFGSGSTTSYLPMLFNHSFGGSYDAAFYVQNVDTSHTASITIKFYDNAGNLTCSLPDTVAPLASKGYWVPFQSCLPAGWVGGAVVTSDWPIVTIGRPHVGNEVTSYSGFSGGNTSMYVPMLFKKAFGGSYVSAFYVQNIDPANSANISIKFYDSAGNLTCILPDTVAALASKGYWVPDLSCLPAGWVGGAVVTADRNIVTVGRPHVGTQVTTYPGIGSGGTNLYLPMLFKNMWGNYDSAFYVQNTDAVNPAHVILKFYDMDGRLSCTRSDDIPPLATLGYWVPSVACDP